jgi:hypothetical protein
MELNLKKPTLSLRKPTLNLTKAPAVSPFKIENGQEVRKNLATSKKQALASKMV